MRVRCRRRLDLRARVRRAGRSADLLAQSDDDAFRPADVAKPIRVLVLHHFAYQLGPVGEQPRDDSVDVFDGEHDWTDAQRVHRRVHGPKPDRFGRVKLVELDATVAVRSPHQRQRGANVLEPDQAVDRRPLDLRFAFELEAELDEERLGRLEVVDNDENVVHPLNRHVPGAYGRMRSRERDSNSRPELYKSPALPTELSRQDLYSRASPQGITAD